MALVAIQCKNCGGALQVDSGATSYFCPHCHTTYAMEQTVNQTFQTTHIGKATIIDDGSGKIDQEINSGEAFLSLRKYPAAREAFVDLTARYAHKYRAWWGLARAYSEEFTKDPSGKKEFEVISDAIQNALQLAPATEKAEMKEASTPYFTKWESYTIQLSEERTQRMDEIQRMGDEYLAPRKEKVSELEALVTQKQNKIEKMESSSKTIPLIAYGIITVLLELIIGFSRAADIIGVALILFIVIYLPVRLVYFLVYKGRRLYEESVIKHTKADIGSLSAEIHAREAQMETDSHTVYVDTGWIDR